MLLLVTLHLRVCGSKKSLQMPLQLTLWKYDQIKNKNPQLIKNVLALQEMALMQ